MATGFAAMKFGWTAYFVPFLFVYSPTLILLGEPADIVINVATAIIGTYFASLGVVGYLFRPLNPLFRVLMVAAGLAAMLPYEILEVSALLNGGGVMIGILIVVIEFTTTKRLSRQTETS